MGRIAQRLLVLLTVPSALVSACGGLLALDSGEAGPFTDAEVATWDEGLSDGPESVPRDAGTDPRSADGRRPAPNAFDSSAYGCDEVSRPPPLAGPTKQKAVECQLGTDRTAFLLAQSGRLYRFDASTRVATAVGSLPCATSATPFTMAVGAGAAYVLYSDASLFRVDVRTLACTKLPFNPGQLGLPGNSAIAVSSFGDRDALFVYGPRSGACTATLATYDLVTFEMREVGAVLPNPTTGFPLEMKADAYQRLLAMSSDGVIFAIDRATALVQGRTETGFTAGPANGLLPYEEELFIFVREDGTIGRYDFGTRIVSVVGAVGEAIVGAGTAPCVHR